MRSFAIFGWLLCTYHGGTLAWFETREDCQLASKYTEGWTSNCIPDRFEIEKLK